MAHSPPFTPPSSPSFKGIHSNRSFHLVNPIGTPAVNCIADSLGVSPLYRQQNSARWHSAAHIYQSRQGSRVHSRAHSPTPDSSGEGFVLQTSGTPTISENASSFYNTSGTPLSLIEIGRANRKLHAEQDLAGNIFTNNTGFLELEAIAAVHELSSEVDAIAVSEILPRTADLIFVNIKSVEGHPFTLELTMKGWRVASLQCDSMNGDYRRVDLHTKYFENALNLLDVISPDHANYFTKCLISKLQQLQTYKVAQEEIDKKPATKKDDEQDSSDDGLVFTAESSA